MKKLLFPLAILGMFFFASCGGDDPDDGPGGDDTVVDPAEVEKQEKMASVPDDRVALYMKSSGTLCPPCGGWGWNVHGQVISEAGDNIAPVTIHSANFVSRDFINEEGNKIDADLGINSWPSFLVSSGAGGRIEKAALSGNTEEALKSGIISAIEEAIADQDVKVGAALKWSVTNNEITVDVRTRFFDEMPEGEYFVSVWVDESLIQAPQSGHPDGSPFHKHVLRTATDNHSVYGIALNTDGGAIAKDQLFETTHTAEFPEGAWDQGNCVVTAVIWTVSGTISKSYAVLNASQATFE